MLKVGDKVLIKDDNGYDTDYSEVRMGGRIGEVTGLIEEVAHPFPVLVTLTVPYPEGTETEELPFAVSELELDVEEDE